MKTRVMLAIGLMFAGAAFLLFMKFIQPREENTRSPKAWSIVYTSESAVPIRGLMSVRCRVFDGETPLGPGKILPSLTGACQLLRGDNDIPGSIGLGYEYDSNTSEWILQGFPPMTMLKHYSDCRLRFAVVNTSTGKEYFQDFPMRFDEQHAGDMQQDAVAKDLPR